MVKTFLVTLTLIVAMPLAAPADACDCASLPACHALWAADSVFVGRVERVARDDGRPRHAEVRVERWLRGEQPGPRVVIDTRGAGISCDAISFEEGRRYLVYAVRGAQGEWRTKLCGGTMPLEFAAKALDYARRTLGRSSPGRLSGFAFIDVLPDPNALDGPPLAGAALTLVSPTQRYRTKTDADGNYRFDRVAAGEYVLHVETLPGTEPVPPKRLVVGADACVSHGFWTSPR